MTRLKKAHAVDVDEPCFVISVAARLIGVHEQTLRYYERAGLIQPRRSREDTRGIRLYSPGDIERVRQIRRLMDELGVNLAGAEVFIRVNERLRQAELELTRLREEVERLRQVLGEGSRS